MRVKGGPPSRPVPHQSGRESECTSLLNKFVHLNLIKKFSRFRHDKLIFEKPKAGAKASRQAVRQVQAVGTQKTCLPCPVVPVILVRCVLLG